MIGSAAIPLGTVLFGPIADLFDIAHILLGTSAAQLLLLLTTFKTVPTSFESGVLVMEEEAKDDEVDIQDANNFHNSRSLHFPGDLADKINNLNPMLRAFHPLL